MDLSIVIPVYDEGNKIARDIETAAAFIESNHFAGEITASDYGSEERWQDRLTA